VASVLERSSSFTPNGMLYLSSCYTNGTESPGCAIWSVDLSQSPAPVTLVTSWIYDDPPLSSPWYMFASVAFDFNRLAMWMARDCRGVVEKVDLSSGARTVYNLPSETPCLTQTVYDPVSDSIWGILSTAETFNGEQNPHLANLDVTTGQVSVVVTLPQNDYTAHPPQQVSTMNTDTGVFWMAGLGSNTFGINVTNGDVVAEFNNPQGWIALGWNGGSKIWAVNYPNVLAVQNTENGSYSDFMIFSGVPVSPRGAVTGGIFCSSITSAECGDTFLVQYYRKDPDNFFVLATNNDFKSVQIPLNANRFTFAPDGNMPFSGYNFPLFAYVGQNSRSMD